MPLKMAKRVLLIDDQEDIRTLVEIFLEMEGGFDLATAESGEEGVKVAADQVPDVIVLDYMMPGMDGPATFRALRAQESTREVPIIFMTGMAQGTDSGQFGELVPAAVIPKPITPEALIGTLNLVLTSQR